MLKIQLSDSAPKTSEISSKLGLPNSGPSIALTLVSQGLYHEGHQGSWLHGLV